MAKFKYLGKDNTFVGRFGRLKTGDVVELWETESEYVLSHPTNPPVWKLVKEDVDKEGVGVIKPAITKHFDLTRVFWLREGFAFLNRQSRSELLAITRAFRDIGAKILSEEKCQCLSREALKELIYGEAKRLQWVESKEPQFVPAVKVKQVEEEVVAEEVSVEAQAEVTTEVSDEAPVKNREKGRPVKKEEKQGMFRSLRREK